MKPCELRAIMTEDRALRKCRESLQVRSLAQKCLRSLQLSEDA